MTTLQSNRFALAALRNAEETAADALHSAEFAALEVLSAETALDAANRALRIFERDQPERQAAGHALPGLLTDDAGLAAQHARSQAAVTAAEVALNEARVAAATANERHQAAQARVREVRQQVYRSR